MSDDTVVNGQTVAYWQAKVAAVIEDVIRGEKISREAWTCLRAISHLCAWAKEPDAQVPPQVGAAIEVLRLFVLRDAKP